MKTQSRRWSKDLVAQVRTQLDSVPAQPLSAGTEDWRFHEAAAVLAWFELNPSLQPVGVDAKADTAAMTRLVEDSISWSVSGQRRRWTLKNDLRKEMLERLGTLERIRTALSSNPNRPVDVLQRMFESIVAGEVKPLETQDLDELTATLQALDWLPPTIKANLPGLPDESQIRHRIESESLLAPFRTLSNEQFRGREKELEVLRDYVGVLKPSSGRAWLYRSVREFLNWHEKPPLVISGPGGIGKSTLLSRFILEHTGQEPALPFIYLDCDRPGLVPEEPLTLLLEGVRQLGIQFSSFSRASVDWISYWRERLARTTESADSGGALDTGTQSRDELLKSCSIFVEELGLGERPLLFVLDTFEEVQYRGSAYVSEIWRFLEEFQLHLPRLRTVIVGRARVRDLPAENVQLDSLSAEAAESFLQVNGVADTAVAKALAGQLRRNPLSLKLAVQVLRHETADLAGLHDLGVGGLLQRVDDNRIQGELYRRILSHIENDDVRRLAHPGLILRRITPAIIEHVLAGPCGVRVESSVQAEQLFQEMRREVALVAPSFGADLAVRHRSDVRRIMLELLRKAEPERTVEIEKAAVHYYETLEDQGMENRAEEIYHRIGLGQSPEEISSRWMPGVEGFLRNAVEDFSGAKQAYLAAHLGVASEALRLDDESDESWELIAGKQAEDLLRLNRPEEALIVLHGRGARSEHSPLYLLEARALLQLGRVVEARQIARRAIQRWGSETPPELLDLVVIVTQADEVLGESLDADFPARFEQLSRSFPDDLRIVSLGLSWARLLKKSEVSKAVPTGEAYRKLQLGITAVLSTMPEETLRQAPELLRDLISEQVVVAEEVLSRAKGVIARVEANLPADSQRVVTDRSEPLPRSQIKSSFSAEQIRRLSEAILDAFSSISELESLVRMSFGRSLTDLVAGGQPMAVIVQQLVDVANSEMRLNDLLISARKLRPSNLRLQVLEKQLEILTYDSVQPVQTRSVAGGLPFLGRLKLREFLKRIENPDADPVLLIMGPIGSGKSYSLRLIEEISFVTKRFDLVAASAEQARFPVDLVTRLALEADWNVNTIPRRDDLPARFNSSLCRWIISHAARRRKPILFFIDDLNSPEIDEASDLISFVQMLADSISVSTISSLKLILAGEIKLTPRTRFQIEELTALTLNDVMQYVSSFVKDPQKLRDVYQFVEANYGKFVESGDTANRDLNNFLAQLVEPFLENPIA